LDQSRRRTTGGLAGMDQKVQKLLNEALTPRLARNRRRQVTHPYRGLDLLHAKERTLAMTGTPGRLISSTPEQSL